MVISFKILDAVQGKDVMSGLDLKSLGISLSFFGFYRQRLHWEMKLEKIERKADEQVLRALILSWELVTAMSAWILFCWCKWGRGCPLLTKLAVLTGDIIVPQLLIVILSPSTAFWTATISGSSGWTETRDLGGLNPLATLTASVKGKYPPNIPSCKMEMATAPNKE